VTLHKEVFATQQTLKCGLSVTAMSVSVGAKQVNQH